MSNMGDYTDETFEIIWRFKATDGEDYVAVKNKDTNAYQVYRSSDIAEVSYTNYAVKNGHVLITATLNEVGTPCFISAFKNLVHSAIGTAALVPHGLDIFQPKDVVEHYAVYGKLMSQYSWLTWVKGSPTWPQVMANILGSKNPE